MKKNIFALLVILFTIIFLSCSNNKPNNPVISTNNNASNIRLRAFIPDSAEVSIVVKLVCEKISSNKKEISIFFNGVKAETDSIIVNKYDSYIYTRVPEGAKTGKIKLISGSDETISDYDFKIVNIDNPPIINFFTPETTSYNNIVSIYGYKFDIIRGKTKVFIDSVECPITYIDYNQIKIRIPLSARTGKIIIKTNGGTGISNKDLNIIFLKYAQIEINNLKYQEKMVESAIEKIYDKIWKLNYTYPVCFDNNMQSLSFCLFKESNDNQYSARTDESLTLTLDTSKGIIYSLNYSIDDYSGQHTNWFKSDSIQLEFDINSIPLKMKNDTTWIFEIRNTQLYNYITKLTRQEFYQVGYGGPEIRRVFTIMKYYPTTDSSFVLITLKR